MTLFLLKSVPNQEFQINRIIDLTDELLYYALRPRRFTAIRVFYHSQKDEPSVDVDMARLLLERGARPNKEIHLNDGKTIWALFLLSCYESATRDEASTTANNAWYVASNLLCQKGADPECFLADDHPGLTVTGVLERLFGGDKALRRCQDRSG